MKRTRKSHVKHLMSILLTLCIIISSSLALATASAADTPVVQFESGGLKYEITLEATADAPGEAKIVPNSYTGTSYTIPSTVTYNTYTYNVTEIGADAFYNCANLTQVTIPQGIKIISAYAFARCTSLASIDIPDSVITVGGYAFWLTQIPPLLSAPIGITWGGVNSTVGTWSVEDGAGGYEVSLYNDGVKVGESKTTTQTSYDFATGFGETLTAAHTFCVRTVPADATVNTKSISAWSNAYPTAEAVGFSFISGDIKYEITALSSDTAPGEVKVVNKSYLNTTYTIPSTVTYNSKTYNVTTIGHRAFYGCGYITSVIIQHGVTTIEDIAFLRAISLESIVIPDSVISLGNDVFDDTKLPSLLPSPTGVKWDEQTSTKGVWDAVEGAAGYRVRLFKNGEYAREAIYVGNVTSYDFADDITDIVGYSFGVRAIPADETTQMMSITKLSEAKMLLETGGQIVSITYVPPTDDTPIYNIDFTWGAMEFTYNAGGPGVWNYETYQYEGAAEESWTADVPGGDLMSIVNNSNAPLTATFTYTSMPGYESVIGKFEGAGVANGEAFLPSAEYGDPENPAVATVRLVLGGTVPADYPTAKTDIGIITLTLSAVS